MTRIELDDVTKEFGELTAVDSLGLEVKDGEFLVLVGPSGCGKSTTLRMLAGLESVSAGEILADDEPITDVEPKDRNVAMVFQNYALYPHMSAKRNMTFGMNSAGDYTDEEIEERVANAAEILDIADLLDRKPRALSGGEKQRVAIGRALVREPDYLLMDEPLSNLDAKLRIQTRAELAELHDRLETTTVYVTHDQTEAMTLGDRVAVLNDGKLQQVARPQELYDYPANRFVAEFIGSPAMNAIPVRLRTDGDERVVTAEGVRIRLPPTDDLESLEDGTYYLGIRPEDLSVDPDGESDRLSVTVSVTEPLGDVTLLHGYVGETPVKAQVGARSELRRNETVEFGVASDRLHLFDEETGEAVYHSNRTAAPIERELG
jgi:multiple sugar transport system ATP-binding protein